MGTGEWISTSMPYLTPPSGKAGDVWATEAASRNRKGTQRVIDAGEAAAPSDVARLLRVAEGATVVVRRRMMLLDDRPCELTDTYYPAHIGAGTRLAKTAKIPGGAVALLAGLGHVAARALEDVTARMPSPEECEALDIGPDVPVLRLTRTVLDRADQPIQVEMMTMPADVQRLRYEIRIG
ncbi:UTRA domain-containing protein [Streptomyces amakusaensis]|uniref:GntR family transcriptional regulator n=1 Tax=Streptomyces amakusaensis TaxID=67271 RepID=A0ABW0AGV9_9ACTN